MLYHIISIHHNYDQDADGHVSYLSSSQFRHIADMLQHALMTMLRHQHSISINLTSIVHFHIKAETVQCHLSCIAHITTASTTTACVCLCLRIVYAWCLCWCQTLKFWKYAAHVNISNRFQVTYTHAQLSTQYIYTGRNNLELITLKEHNVVQKEKLGK